MSVVPSPLVKGDTVAIVAPAGNIHDVKRYYLGCSILSDMGFHVYQKDNLWPGSGFFADHDIHRADELMRAWENPDIKGIVALRGGYGSLRILDRLDISVIEKHPKMFVGFSDISILLNVIYAQTGQICLHGPVLSSLGTSDRDSIERFYHCLVGNWHKPLIEKVEIIRSAPTVSGPLLGGNLSSLVTILGTRWQPDIQNSILFLEDINEPLYRLDRLLTQFHMCGQFDHIKGVILGDFSNEDDHGRSNEFVWQRVYELTEDQNIPLWGNFPIGHKSQNITLPLGAVCTMDSSKGALRFKDGMI